MKEALFVKKYRKKFFRLKLHKIETIFFECKNVFSAEKYKKGKVIFFLLFPRKCKKKFSIRKCLTIFSVVFFTCLEGPNVLFDKHETKRL